MKPTKGELRRKLAVAFAATAAGGAAVAALLGPSATAASDPCAASEVSRTVGKVATNTGDYLDSHPQTNQALTTILQQQAGPQTLASLKAYFDANPQVAKDMQQLQQPLQSLGTKCKLPVTLPQLLGLMQAAQQQGATLPGGLPGGLPSAQTVGVPSASVPAQSSPASAVTQGAGPLPGPASVIGR
ncbi:hemophore [Mycolicibacterium wolinskyi]|uniref:Fis family transcriptional regulator n=1 Tax=Mycolicibacterium wolinskyi TaxID=59750 RepID=A0A1X2ET75_9MYCO|nr:MULTISPECIES: hemophore [Mycolicibacterium]MCV7287417.1 hemophore [Mycolicibacterium wolinskyi]MCV7294944.1 hemophore [Mycolicibacterium goodii]ORX09228.1 Fis family transcriptional regulator [Mycolicibacterium wolinskyi]